MFAKDGGVLCLRKLHDAPVAQIRGRFINWDGWFAKDGGVLCLRKLHDAPVAQIRGRFINWDGWFAKVIVLYV
jgi:hypothetical protein